MGVGGGHFLDGSVLLLLLLLLQLLLVVVVPVGIDVGGGHLGGVADDVGSSSKSDEGVVSRE